MSEYQTFLDYLKEKFEEDEQEIKNLFSSMIDELTLASNNNLAKLEDISKSLKSDFKSSTDDHSRKLVAISTKFNNNLSDLQKTYEKELARLSSMIKLSVIFGAFSVLTTVALLVLFLWR